MTNLSSTCHETSNEQKFAGSDNDKVTLIHHSNRFIIQSKIFSFWVEGIASFSVGTLGFLGNLVMLVSYFYPVSGNCITIAVMRKKEFTQTFHKLLTALAVFDNIFIASAIFTLAIRLL